VVCLLLSYATGEGTPREENPGNAASTRWGERLPGANPAPVPVRR
jgi:hypothetical protein